MACFSSFCTGFPLGSKTAWMRYTLPVMDSPFGTVAFAGGATGSRVSAPDRWPAGATMEWGRSNTLAWESFVANRPSVATPWRNLRVNRPGRGGLLMDRRLGGGLANRYGGGGANPSRRGRRASGLRRPLSEAKATYRTAAPTPK